jgi:hypothetical protein
MFVLLQAASITADRSATRPKNLRRRCISRPGGYHVTGGIARFQAVGPVDGPGEA